MAQATKTRWQDLILWDGTSEIGITLEYDDEGFEEIVRRYRDTGEIHGYWLVDPRDYEDDDYDGLDSGPTPDEIDWEGLDEITLDWDLAADWAVPCPGCGGEAHPLGVLGDLCHYRCRDCGGEHSLALTDHHAPRPGLTAMR